MKHAFSVAPLAYESIRKSTYYRRLKSAKRFILSRSCSRALLVSVSTLLNNCVLQIAPVPTVQPNAPLTFLALSLALPCEEEFSGINLRNVSTLTTIRTCSLFSNQTLAVALVFTSQFLMGWFILVAFAIMPSALVVY